jgi:hypothetical protein
VSVKPNPGWAGDLAGEQDTNSVLAVTNGVCFYPSRECKCEAFIAHLHPEDGAGGASGTPSPANLTNQRLCSTMP